MEEKLIGIKMAFDSLFDAEAVKKTSLPTEARSNKQAWRLFKPTLFLKTRDSFDPIASLQFV